MANPAPPSSPGAGRPVVAVCLAPTDLRPDVDPLTGQTTTDRRQADLTASDAAALEFGLRAAEAWGALLVAVAAGPPDIEGVLAAAAALGATAIRVAWPASGPAASGPEVLEPAELAGEPTHLAGVLAAAIASVGPPTLVICGDRSALAGVGALPARLAHELGAAQALGLVSVTFEDAPGTLTGERRLDGGWREVVRTRGPAVISVEAAGVRLRRASLAAALAPAPVAVWHPVGEAAYPVRWGSPRPYRPRTRVVPAPVGDTRHRLLALTDALSSREPPRIVGPVDAGAAADELIAYLERRGFDLAPKP